MTRRLEQATERFEELERLLADPELANRTGDFAKLSKEYADLQRIVETGRGLQALADREREARGLLEDDEMKAMAREEIEAVERERGPLQRELRRLIVPTDPNDERNLFLEIRAGTGGQEAALFAGDLLRMYTRFAERNGDAVEMISGQSGEAGGWREVVVRVAGHGAYSRLKFESGTHRVQRVPATESQGRIHTSACTVAILPEVEAVDAIEIDANELRIDTFRASGAGGQHVNTTDSAIRITHEPTGLVVECQDERSQHKNKARALALLSARLLEREREQQHSEQAEARRLQVGSGDRSERIRTYNFPQGRITDHRIGLTVYDLDNVLEGDLDVLVGPLNEADQADRLAELG